VLFRSDIIDNLSRKKITSIEKFLKAKEDQRFKAVGLDQEKYEELMEAARQIPVIKIVYGSLKGLVPSPLSLTSNGILEE